MTTFFYAIADAAEACFKVLPYILKGMDLFFAITGAILSVGWIWYMIRHQDEEKGYNAPESAE